MRMTLGKFCKMKTYRVERIDGTTSIYAEVSGQEWDTLAEGKRSILAPNPAHGALLVKLISIEGERVKPPLLRLWNKIINKQGGQV